MALLVLLSPCSLTGYGRELRNEIEVAKSHGRGRADVRFELIARSPTFGGFIVVGVQRGVIDDRGFSCAARREALHRAV